MTNVRVNVASRDGWPNLFTESSVTKSLSFSFPLFLVSPTLNSGAVSSCKLFSSSFTLFILFVLLISFILRVTECVCVFISLVCVEFLRKRSESKQKTWNGEAVFRCVIFSYILINFPSTYYPTFISA